MDDLENSAKMLESQRKKQPAETKKTAKGSRKKSGKRRPGKGGTS